MISRVDRISKSYGNHRVLDEVSFEIDKGMVFALCGPSGSGKTTLVRIISGLLGFDSGRMVLGETVIAAGQLYPETLYGKIGVVFQEHNLFPHMTALQNVTLGLRKVRRLSREEANERAMVEFDKVMLTGKVTQYPSSLSGGERQRVAIARALAMDPMILLLDEPTSGLDQFQIGEVLRTIKGLSDAGTSMLLVTHNLRFAKHTGDRFALIEDGRIKVSEDSSLLDSLAREWLQT